MNEQFRPDFETSTDVSYAAFGRLSTRAVSRRRRWA